VPPYWGVPSESHQFPVPVVVTEVVADAADVVDVEMVVDGMLNVVMAVVEGALVVVETLVVVDVEQDANTNDVTIRMVRVIQMAPLFI
jgi:hypothetical protein